MRTAIYPGTFDPITYGHIDIIKRATTLFDKVIIAVATNPSKSPLFSVEERVDIIKHVIIGIENIEVDSFNDLLVNYALKKKAIAVIRGLRAISDFEYEFQMALMNRKLNRDVQTVFLMTGLRWIFTSSSIIKEAVQFGGDIESMVPAVVYAALKEKYQLD